MPNTTISITEVDKAIKILKLIETLEEDDDVERVWSNEDIPEYILEEADRVIDSQKFKT